MVAIGLGRLTQVLGVQRQLGLLLWALLGLHGCTVSLDLPTTVAIACEEVGDCPTGYRCAQELSLCIVSDVNQDRGPLLQAASAGSPTDILLTFDRMLSLGNVEQLVNYSITPNLQILAADPLGDRQRIRLTTAAQQSGVEYTITVHGLMDVTGVPMQAAGSSQDFLGFGTPPDTAPPLPLSPSPREGVSGDAVLLAWQGRFGATEYTVEISLQPDFSTLVLDTPRVQDALSTTLVVHPTAPTTHYWRVRADFSATDEWGVSSFDPLFGAIYVYCAESESCDAPSSDEDPAETGSPSQPFRSIQRAIDRARALFEEGNVLIAARGGSAAYEESIVAAVGISLEGGYPPGFASLEAEPSVNITTVLSTSATTVVAAGIRGRPTVLRGLRIERQGGSLPTAVRIIESDYSLRFENCHVQVSGGSAENLAISVADGASTGFAGVQVIGSRIVSGFASMSTAVRASGARLSLIDSEIEVEGATFVATGALSVEFGHIRLEGTRMHVGSAEINLGIDVRSAFATLLQSRIIAEQAIYENLGVRQIDSGTVFVHGSEIHAAGSSLGRSTGVMMQTGLFWGDNCILTSGDTVNETTAIDLEYGVEVVLIHCTLVSGVSSGGPSSVVAIYGGRLTLVNSLLASRSENAIGLLQFPADNFPVGLLNNAWLPMAAYFGIHLASSYGNIAAINNLDGEEANSFSCPGDQCEHMQVLENTSTIQTLSEVFVAPHADPNLANWRLNSTVDANIATGAIVTSNAQCGSYERSYPCGTIDTDFDQVPRTVPTSIGAFEIDVE